MLLKKLNGGMMCMCPFDDYHNSYLKFFLFSILQKNSCSAIIGSGIEENRNGPEPMSACLAAPRGICNGIMNGESVLFIADSNSSSIRVVTLKDGNVANLVGGDADPTV
jgi:hypothetical protein